MELHMGLHMELHMGLQTESNPGKGTTWKLPYIYIYTCVYIYEPGSGMIVLKKSVTAWACWSPYFTYNFSMCYVFVCLTVLCVVIVHVLCFYYQSVLCMFFCLCYVRALVCVMSSLQSRTSSLRFEHASLRSRGSPRSLRALRARKTRFEPNTAML